MIGADTVLCCWVKANTAVWKASIYLSKCLVSFWPFVYSSYQCHSHFNAILEGFYLRKLFTSSSSFWCFCLFFSVILRKRVSCATFSSPLLSDKDVTLICFMDIKFRLVRGATNFYVFDFKEFLPLEFLRAWLEVMVKVKFADVKRAGFVRKLCKLEKTLKS